MTMLSETFSGVATLATGVIALIVYSKQKSDAKVQAARVLLVEIRAAEERIRQIREQTSGISISDLPLIFPSNSWNKYSHLFVSDFDQDELRLISSFYDYGEQIEIFAKRNNDFFWVNSEERAKATQQKVAEMVKETVHSITADSDLNEINRQISLKKATFEEMYGKNTPTYTPQKTLSSIQSYLGKIEPITTSSSGTKLKKIAKVD